MPFKDESVSGRGYGKRLDVGGVAGSRFGGGRRASNPSCGCEASKGSQSAKTIPFIKASRGGRLGTGVGVDVSGGVGTVPGGAIDAGPGGSTGS